MALLCSHYDITLRLMCPAFIIDYYYTKKYVGGTWQRQLHDSTAKYEKPKHI